MIRSQSTQELVYSLYSRVPLVERLRGGAPDREALLCQIAESAEPGWIFSLIPLALSREPVAEAAAATIRQLLETLKPLALPQFDEMARGYPFHWNKIWRQWDRINPSDLDRLDRLVDGWAVAATLSCHRSGYVREAAVRRLFTAPVDRSLPFLLLRTNDWVSPVRRAATEAVEALLTLPNTKSWYEKFGVRVERGL
jgi:hypothetical protein